MAAGAVAWEWMPGPAIVRVRSAAKGPAGCGWAFNRMHKQPSLPGRNPIPARIRPGRRPADRDARNRLNAAAEAISDPQLSARAAAAPYRRKASC